MGLSHGSHEHPEADRLLFMRSTRQVSADFNGVGNGKGKGEREKGEGEAGKRQERHQAAR